MEIKKKIKNWHLHLNKYLSIFFPSSYSCVNLHNQQHVLVMCAVAFYMMENYPLDVGTEFMAGVIQVNILLSRAGGKRSSKQKE